MKRDRSRGMSICLGTAFLISVWAPVTPTLAGSNVWQMVRGDYAAFYTAPRLIQLGGGLLAAGIVANTSIDEDVHNWVQDDFRSSGSDDFAKVVKPLGNGVVTVPILAGVTLLGVWADDSSFLGTAGTWSGQSLRSMVVGVPPLLVLQNVLGSGRPKEGVESDWKPFEDDNGASGHAFMGAVPFLVAANMSEHWGSKAAFYVASTLCGLSRINDDDHYLSQVMVGWGLAYLSAEAVDRSNTGPERVRLGAFVDNEYAGLDLRIAF